MVPGSIARTRVGIVGTMLAIQTHTYLYFIIYFDQCLIIYSTIFYSFHAPLPSSPSINYTTMVLFQYLDFQFTL